MLLPADMIFLNADMIAQELTGKPGTSADINAGRILLDKIEALEAKMESFAFETTLATKMLSERVREWRERGYEVHLVFFYLSSADLAVNRVRQRVRDGGHDVPESTIRRRYVQGMKHFLRIYRDIVDTWRLYDNSGGPEPQPIARGTADGEIRIECPIIWEKLVRELGQ